MTKMWRITFQLAVSAIAGNVSAAESVAPPALCMSQCELAGRCEQLEFEEYPDFDTTLEQFPASCSAGLLYAVEGVCASGRKIIATGTGFTSEIKFYATNGNFEGLITQTDVVMRPCMGQSFWPEFLQCEAPTVTQNLCGGPFEVGDPAFQNRWSE
jgi:hypothetical protein